MTDSCSPSKLEPGLAATYSIPRSRITCTIRSEPGRMTVRSRAPATGRTLPASRLTCSADGGGAELFALPFCAASRSGIGTEVPSAAAPAAAVAAPFRNPRRFTAIFFGFVIGASPVNRCRRVRTLSSGRIMPRPSLISKSSRSAKQDLRAFRTDLEGSHRYGPHMSGHRPIGGYRASAHGFGAFEGCSQVHLHGACARVDEDDAVVEVAPVNPVPAEVVQGDCVLLRGTEFEVPFRIPLQWARRKVCDVGASIFHEEVARQEKPTSRHVVRRPQVVLKDHDLVSSNQSECLVGGSFP